MSADTISDILVKTTDLPRVPLAEGIGCWVLHTSSETETWTTLLCALVGSPYAKHRHLGQGKIFLVKGRMEYRAVSAIEGEYGYKFLNAVNKETNFPKYSELYFTNHGPVVFLDDDDNVTSILDHRVLTQLAAAHSSEAKTA